MYQAAFLFIIFLVFRVITGVFLLRTWRETKKKNLLILVIFFFMNAFTLLFLIFGNIMLYDVNTILTMGVGLIFINRTFYQDRKSPFKLLLALTLVLGTLAIISFTIFEYSIIFQQNIAFLLHNIFVGADFVIFGLWSFIATLESLKSFSSSDAVEPWVKGRYRLVKFYSICIMFVGFLTLFTPVEGTVNWALLVILIANILRISGETMAWIMPNFLKKYFNRGFTSTGIIEELSEEEILEAMK
ncbi:hypothetical protein LCGC14_0874510 [marine sediment metagenome]|uniref:7TM-DISM receptor extracellular domain-containing protein n=1 Tax=marine sediment metagenome TaxID=412755 RepID=A0A0F9P8M2_9ZZZZ|nr:MAG: hypothetical protein Lokiarch_42590 [Candidatus Lokiarchaeum sp. GC14_75]HEC40635.1 hypothetical protein [bacterium]